MSVAAIQPPAVVYREEQNFGWWVYLLLAFLFAFGLFVVVGPFRIGPAAPAARRGALDIPLALAVGVTLPSVLVVGVLRMTTEVAPGTLRLWFGFVPTYRRSFDLAEIARIEVVRYRPWRDCGGWGIRLGPDGERVYNARGDRGVRIHFANGSRLLIGSQRPEALAVAIEKAMTSVT